MRFVYDIDINVMITTSRGHLVQSFTPEEDESVEEFMKRVSEWVKRESESFQ